MHSGKNKQTITRVLFFYQSGLKSLKYERGKLPEVAVPDIDGGVGQDLAVTVPAAVGGGTATGRVVSADLAEDLAFAGLAQVQLQVWVTLAVTWCEAETPYPVHFNERQVKLVKMEQGKKKETVSKVFTLCSR